MTLNSSLFNWGANSDLSPCLISASDFYGKHVQITNHCIHDTWSLDYTYTGHGRFRVGSPSAKWFSREPHTAHLYPAHTNYWEDTTQESGDRHSSWFLFDKGWEAGLQKIIPEDAAFARFEDPDGLLGELIIQAAQIGERDGQDGFWEAQALFCRVIHLMLNAEPIDRESFRIRTGSEQESDFISQVNRLLRQNLNTRLSLQNLAGQLHISPSALSHKYKRETGSPPMAALQVMRIEAAKAFLQRGFPLKAIADELGFSDEFHLSKAFKKITGLAPRYYLKKKITLNKPVP